MVRYTSLKKFKNYSGEINPLEFDKDMRAYVSLKLILKRKGCNWQYVRLPFCWSWPGGSDILQKRGGSIKRGQWLQNRGYKHLFTLALEFEKFHAGPVCFLLFFGDKKIAFKSSLDLTFISSLLIFFHLPIYS